jgi:hypothetical protein
VDVLLVPQLLPHLVHLQAETEIEGCPQQKCNGLTVKYLNTRQNELWSEHDFMPCDVAFASDAFMDIGAVFELGGLFCSFSIAFNRENDTKVNFE